MSGANSEKFEFTISLRTPTVPSTRIFIIESLRIHSLIFWDAIVLVLVFLIWLRWF